MKKILAMLVGFAFAWTVALQAAPAMATPSGIMNYNEWSTICDQYEIDHWGHTRCLDTWSRAEVENFCNCTGEVINSWTSNGHSFRSVRYFSPYDEYNRLTYRQWSAGDPWKAQNKDWRLGSSAYQTG